MSDMQQKLLVMLDLQGQMNARVHPQWKSQNFPWYRAIWTEAAELLEHYGWKWWKKQEPDTEQVVLELIDIWHFGLSECLQHGSDLQSVAADLEGELRTEPQAGLEFREAIESFAGQVLLRRRFDGPGFAQLMLGAGLEFDELYSSYIGKNVLNLFRQDNGYRDGSYRKTWGGREDNEHLVELSRVLDHASPAFKDDLYAALEQRYAAAV